MTGLAILLILVGLTDIVAYLHVKRTVDELNSKVAELNKTVALHNLIVIHNKSLSQAQSNPNTLLG
jgi:hypothetical protein